MEILIKILKRKKTIGFWAGDENNFTFLNPLIEFLSKRYKVQKFQFNGDVQNLAEQMKLVDLAWLEWGQGPIWAASNTDKIVPIINRIHRYEVYTDAPHNFNYKNIDSLIFISPSVESRFKTKFINQYSLTKPVVIPIGVDLLKFRYAEKPDTKSLVYVGRIHPHKNPSLLLQIMAKLVKEDASYKLTVIGAFDDELYEEFFWDQIEKLNLIQNVCYMEHMPQEALVKHLQSSDYFIISSIIEGFSQACAEAMACGVRPVVSSYWGSEQAYPHDCIYSTVDEAVEIIKNHPMSRNDSHSFIRENYNFSEQSEKVASLINELIR